MGKSGSDGPRSTDAFRYWWEPVLALPESRATPAYDRLERVWFDHTGPAIDFSRPATEVHLTATLFENFSFFAAESWVAALLHDCGLPDPNGAVNDVAWGYEVHGISSKKYADVAIHAQDDEGDLVVVVEAKRRTGTLKRGDEHPGTYLDLEAFSWCERRYMIYLVDEADAPSVERAIDDPAQRSAVCSWQRLGGLQVRLAKEEGGAASHVLASAIQTQYCWHGIRPTSLAADYLADEPGFSEITKSNPARMGSARTTMQGWRISKR